MNLAQDLYYNQDWSGSRGLLRRVQPEIKSELGFAAWIELDGTKLKRFSENHTELKMLIHDWTKDPLVFKNPKLIKKITVEQIRAIRRIREIERMNQREINEVMHDFLVDSGLYETFVHSVMKN